MTASKIPLELPLKLTCSDFPFNFSLWPGLLGNPDVGSCFGQMLSTHNSNDSRAALKTHDIKQVAVAVKMKTSYSGNTSSLPRRQHQT